MKVLYNNLESKEILNDWKGNNASKVWIHIQCQGGFVKGISKKNLSLRGKLPGNIN